MITVRDSDRPSTARIIGFIATILGGVGSALLYILTIIVEWEDYYIDQYQIFQYTWGKLLIFFLSGSVFLFLCFLICLTGYLSIRVLRGKSMKFSHIICPFPEVLNQEDLSAQRIERADDKYFIFKSDGLFTDIRWYMVIGAGLLLLFSFYGYQSELNNPRCEVYTSHGAGCMLIFLFLFLSMLFSGPHRIVLDRMNGTITFPRHLFILGPCTIPFSEVDADAGWVMSFMHPRTKFPITVLGTYSSGWWNFYVLYMDRNRPLPQGTAFAPYREKDFLRRQSEGFPKPIYPSFSLVSDANMGYIYGTPEFKQKLSTLKHDIIHCYDRVAWYCQDHNIKIPFPNDLVLIGIWKDQYVFRLFAPENVEYILIPPDTPLSDCFLCDSSTDGVKYIPPVKETKL